MINELFERELRNTTINGVSLADYINENYIVITKTGALQEQEPKIGHWINCERHMVEPQERSGEEV